MDKLMEGLLWIMIGMYAMYIGYKSNSNLTFLVMMLNGFILVCYSFDYMIN